ncbi:hypothetical protein AVEN_234872-1 [Araneus ventricosus]|uniref:Uncharacterized protein n=1 Tax=Araneus ventricosus TaxID=182803 RepID=A0A4Y2IGA0_ARAVE|nr:hypothetical protein AVEN_234872-1 [Araneus ventricosus]
MMVESNKSLWSKQQGYSECRPMSPCLIPLQSSKAREKFEMRLQILSSFRVKEKNDYSNYAISKHKATSMATFPVRDICFWNDAATVSFLHVLHPGPTRLSEGVYKHWCKSRDCDSVKIRNENLLSSRQDVR